ncbi:MAG: S9 family peptidase [Cyclobacteriaceae bacterium]
MIYRLTLLLLLLSSGLAAQMEITFENFGDGTFRQENVQSFNWMNDGQFYSQLTENKILKSSILDNSANTVLFDGSKYGISIDDYSFSADENKILIITDKKSIYRRSFTSQAYIYDVKDETLNKLSTGGPQSYATFSPDGKKVAFARDNNLFVTTLVSMDEKQLTTDGKFNEIINGSSDWVYEEEFSITKAFFWSPDSEKIAFIKFDESNVREYNMQKWNDGANYPEDYRYKYPKAGETNSEVEVHILNLKNGKTVQADIGDEKDIYIPRILWTKDANLLSIIRLNRLQNRLDILHADAATGETRLIYTDKSKTYVDITYTDDLMYLDDGKRFLFSSEKDGYKHFYLHDMDGQILSQVTKGAWEAESFVALDQSGNKPVLYYISTEDSPLERHLYKVNADGKGKEKLSQLAGWNSVDMGEDAKYYIIKNSSANSPLKVSLYRTKGNKLIKNLVTNSSLQRTAEKYQLAEKRFFTFETVDQYELNGFFMVPNDFDSTRKYPVLLYQYSGPGSQNVKNQWAGRHFYWHQMLTQQGYIVAIVDTRGTGGRGAKFKKMTYEQLGKLEAEDHIEAAKYFGTLPFIDKDRIGIWGWSYGGYMSALVMMKGAEYFKAGIAVAPVTTWRFYDTVYTERYLGKPQDNPSGYDDNSPNTHVEKLEGKFLLIHGTGDDNVHFQNAVTLQNRLIDEGKNFQSFYYPDKAHSLSGSTTRIHLYNMMNQFILDNL